MSSFYVIQGFCGPDCYTSDDGPVLEVFEFDTEAKVEAAYRDFIDNLPKEATQVTFRVIEGKELKMKKREVVTQWELDRG